MTTSAHETVGFCVVEWDLYSFCINTNVAIAPACPQSIHNITWALISSYC